MYEVGSGDQTQDTLLKTRTTNEVRNAGCGRSRYTLNFLKSINESMN